MTFLGSLRDIVLGAPLGVVVVTALPIFGAVGSLVGAVCGVLGEVNKG